MADIEQNRMLAGELGGRNRLSLGPGMLMGDDDLEWLFVEKVGGDSGRREGKRNDRRVDAAAPQCRLEILGHVLFDLQRHLRRARVERGNKVRQKIRRNRVDNAEPERADQLIAPGLRDIANARRLLEHLLRLFDDALPDRRYGDLGLAALEKLR